MKKAFIAALLLAAVSLAAQCPPDRMKEVRFTLNDSIIRHDMALLSEHQTIPLIYNDQVEMFISLFVNYRNTQTNSMLQRSYKYFSAIEEVLECHHLPTELKYFAMVESALNPTASARNGRQGLWQLSPTMARQLGLTVDDYINDCFDPELSTEIACQQLGKLHNYYGDWLLTLAALTTSTATVDKAIATEDSRDYWTLCRHLPLETCGYIPAFMAITYIMNYPAEYGLYPACSIDTWHSTELLPVADTLTFEQIQNSIGLPVEQLSQLNPKYVKKTIPGSPEHVLTLRIPKEHANSFKQNFKKQ